MSETTSGQYEGMVPATDLITLAFLQMAVINEDETPTAGMYDKGLKTLNAMVKQWYATGIHVWTEEEAILFLQPNQLRYLLGGTTTDHCTDADEYVQAFVASNVNTGAAVIPLASVTGLVAGMKFGVVLNTGALFWSTIETVGASSVTLVDAVTAAVTAQAFAFAYLTDIVRPLRVPSARRRTFQPAPSYYIDTPLTNVMSREDYQQLPNKTQQGLLTQIFYNPARDQGKMFIWPVPQAATSALRFTWYRPIQTFSSVADLADLPTEWENPLLWNLAKELGPSYSVPPARWQIIVKMADEKYEMVQGWDREPQSVQFGLSYDQTARA